MIFVTVGTHEQQFNRLIHYIEQLKRNDIIAEEVIIQTGFSSYEPKHCIWNNFFTYTEMSRNIKEARIVITHGGPSSFITPLQNGKTPIVVPRKKEYGEHINDHQTIFCNALKERQYNIIVADDMVQLQEAILHYDEISASMSALYEANNNRFCEELNSIVRQLFGE